MRCNKERGLQKLCTGVGAVDIFVELFKEGICLFVCLLQSRWWVTYLTDQVVGIVRDPTKGLQNLCTVYLYLKTLSTDNIQEFC